MDTPSDAPLSLPSWHILLLAIIGTVIPVVFIQIENVALLGAQIKFPFFIALICLYLSAFAFTLFSQKKAPLPSLWLLLPTIFFWSAFCLSLIQATDIKLALIHGGKVYVLPLLLFLAIGTSQVSHKNIRLLFALQIPAGIAVAFVGMATAFGWLSWAENLILVGNQKEVGSFFFNFNMAGEYIIYPVFFLMALLGTEKKRALKLGILPLLIYLLAYLVLTTSRNSWVGMAAGVVVSLIVIASSLFACRAGLRHQKSFAAQTIYLCGTYAGTIIIFLILIFTAPHWTSLARSSSNEPSPTTAEVSVPAPSNKHLDELKTLRSGTEKVRFGLWKNTLMMLPDAFWIGVGAGHYQLEFPRYHNYEISWEPDTGAYTPTFYAHDDYLHILVELGILGLLALVTLFAAISWRAWKGFCYYILSNDMIGISLLFGSFSAFIAFAVTMLFEFPFMMPASSFMGWLCAGLTVTLSNPKPSSRPIARPGVLLCLGAGAFIFVTGLIVGTSQIKEYYYTMQGGFLENTHLGEAVKAYDKAIQSPISSWDEAASVQFMRINLSHDPQKVVAVASEILSRRPYFIPALWFRAQAYGLLGNRNDSRRDTLRLLNNFPYIPKAIHLREWLRKNGMAQQLEAPRRSL